MKLWFLVFVLSFNSPVFTDCRILSNPNQVIWPSEPGTASWVPLPGMFKSVMQMRPNKNGHGVETNIYEP